MSTPFQPRSAYSAQTAGWIWMLVLVALSSANAGDAGSTPRIGFVAETERLDPLAARSGEGYPALVRVDLDWSAVERTRGVLDWSAYEAVVERLTGAGRTVVLVIGGTNPLYLPDGGLPAPEAGESLAAWIDYVRGTVRQFGDRVTIFQVGDRVGADPGIETRIEALVIKQASLAVRAEARARNVDYRVAQPALEAIDLDRQRELWSEDIAAYVDIVPVILNAEAENAVGSLLRESVRHPPAVEIWAYAEPDRGVRPADAAVQALAAGASVALFRPTGTSQAVSSWIAWGTTLDETLSGGFAPAPQSGLRFEEAGGAVLGRFFSERGFESLVVYRAETGDGDPPARLHVEAAVVREVRSMNPTTGETRRLPARREPSGGHTIELPDAETPGLVLFRQAAVEGARSLPPEEIAIESTRGLTAEEIIARHQAVQRDQENRLDRFTAKGRVNYNFRLTEGGSTIDVSVDSQYFWERGGELEWEQLEYYINGNKLRWKKFPRIPLIQPEKVITLPLDLTLNKTYGYRLVGEETVEGRRTYILDFEPAQPGSSLSLYRGRIWIDAERFHRVKLRLIQGNLEPPVISNEEVDRFAETLGPDGGSFVLFSRIDGQQVWNVAGRTFVVRRELTFREFRINPPEEEFSARREQAYESDNTMMRDTETGFRYLDRTDEGGRVVKEKVASSTLFVGAGAFKDASQDNVVPLAAVNYFDYDVANKNLQLNVFFAGAFTFANLSKPDFFGGRMDMTVDLGLSAIQFSDKLYSGENELVHERLDTRPQRLAMRLGFPLGDFFKLTAVAGLNYLQYDVSDDAVEAISGFNARPGNPTLRYLVPEDHLELSGSLEGRFNRLGFTLVARFGHARRSDWEAWGLQDTSSGEFGIIDPVSGVFAPEEPEPLSRDFSLWGVTAFKQWFLPHFQRIRLEGNYLGGADLDRFSRYQFSYFGADRLNGFSGSGLRFDRGVLGRLGYTFNLAEVIRLDVGLDTARVEDERGGAGAQNFTGIGLNANFPAPWRTVVTVGYGRALASDVPEFEGEQEFLLLVLKLF